MKQKKRKDILENKETLNFLINITELLNSTNAIIGRNDKMFAIDMSHVPQLLMNDNADLGTLFIEQKLVVDHDNLFGSMGIVNEYFTDNNILFCDIAESLSLLDHKEDGCYPFHEEVRNWFLSIPKFSNENKDKYEDIYQMNKTEISKLMQERVGELFKAIFSSNGNIDDLDNKKKLH